MVVEVVVVEINPTKENRSINESTQKQWSLCMCVFVGGCAKRFFRTRLSLSLDQSIDRLKEYCNQYRPQSTAERIMRSTKKTTIKRFVKVTRRKREKDTISISISISCSTAKSSVSLAAAVGNTPCYCCRDSLLALSRRKSEVRGGIVLIEEVVAAAVVVNDKQ